MLDTFYFNAAGAKRYYSDEHMNIWKFAASPSAPAKQQRPLILNYSIMTRAYGTCFNKNNFIHFFNEQGFDVYLMDWGKSNIFTLEGWTLDKLADALYEKAVLPLISEYKVDSVNIFGICIGGLITSHLINRGLKRDKNFTKYFHKIAYYGSPVYGSRDLGMARSFMNFHNAVKPMRHLLRQSGISLFTIDTFLLLGTSSAMVEMAWSKFREDGFDTFTKMISLTFDDRWVPFAALFDILDEAFVTTKEEDSFHFQGDVSNIHFFNLVGERDFLVMPSASIVEWNSSVPAQFASFEQAIFPGGHFVFARPAYPEVKSQLASWFARQETKRALVPVLQTAA